MKLGLFSIVAPVLLLAVVSSASNDAIDESQNPARELDDEFLLDKISAEEEELEGRKLGDEYYWSKKNCSYEYCEKYWCSKQCWKRLKKMYMSPDSPDSHYSPDSPDIPMSTKSPSGTKSPKSSKSSKSSKGSKGSKSTKSPSY